MAAQIHGFQQVKKPQHYGPPRRPDLPPVIVLHRVEGVFATAEQNARYIARRMTPSLVSRRNCRPHFWLASPETTSLAYRKGFGGSKVRKSDIAVREGYDIRLQCEDVEEVSWALRGAAGATYRDEDGRELRAETNHAGVAVVQIETVGWSADSPNLTDEELKWEAERYADIIILLEHRLLKEFVPTPYREVGKQGRDEMRVSEWMDRDRQFNIVCHQNVPFNTHWDVGAYPFKEVCEEISNLLKQSRDYSRPSDALYVPPTQKEDLSQRGKNPFPEVPPLNLKPPH